MVDMYVVGGSLNTGDGDFSTEKNRRKFVDQNSQRRNMQETIWLDITMNSHNKQRSEREGNIEQLKDIYFSIKTYFSMSINKQI